MWQRLENLFRKRPKRIDDPWRGAAIYVRPKDDTIIALATATTRDAWWNATHALVGTIPTTASPQAIGELLLTAMSRYNPALDDEVAEAGRKTVPAAAGFKSWSALERTTRHLAVATDGNVVRITPYEISPTSGMAPVLDSPPTCSPDAAAIGRLFLDTLAKMPLPAGTKPKRRPKGSKMSSANPKAPPSQPQSFGYKTAWLAIGTDDPAAVAEALALVDARPCDWEPGLKEAHDLKGVFVTPTVEGWTFAVGKLPSPEEPAFRPLLEQLSSRFGEVQYFANHRVTNYYAWARAEAGRVVRIYAFADGAVLYEHGQRTPEESALALNFSAADIEASEEFPHEEHVIRLAEQWSLNPLDLDGYESAGQGFFGLWREAQ